MARNDSVRIPNLYIHCRPRTRERATGCPIGGDRARFKVGVEPTLVRTRPVPALLWLALGRSV